MPPKASTSSSSRNTDDIVFVKGPQSPPNSNKTPVKTKSRVASSSSSSPASPATTPARQSAFHPATTPVKFYEDEMQARSTSSQSVMDSRRTIKPTSSGFSLKKLAIQLTTLYALIAYFVICPNDPSRAPAVCKSYTDLQQYRNQALAYVTPYFQPYLSQAQNTISQQTEPYVKAASPYYSQAAKIVTPQVQKASSAYEKQLRPRLIDAVTHSHRAILPHTNRISGEYNRLVTPHVNRYSKLATELYDINAKPYVDEVYFEYQRKIKPFYTSLYAKTQPYVSKVYPTTQHHFRHTFLPAAAASYSTSVNTYNKHIHPNLLSSFRFTGRVLSDSVLPSVRRFQSRYIAPQLSKIQDKAWAYKAKKVADEKVEQMDSDLGKSDIQDEIEELLSEIRAESTTISATIGTTTAPIQPTAYGEAGIESKDDPLSNKLQQDAERVRLNAEKRAALEALHDLYEVEIPKLGETELALLADRLSALRTAALRDIPNRFDPAVKSYKAESDKWLGRLEKYWDKADRDERTDVERKVSDGNLIARKAIVKMADAADEFEDEVDAYARTHNVRELTSVEKAFKTIQTFVGKAQEELGNGYAWLDDVSTQDWKRYHTLAALEGSWHHKLFSLKNGTISHPTLDRKLDVEATLNKLKQDIEKANNDFERKLEVARLQGEKRAKGESLGVKDAAARGAAAVAGAFDQASSSAVSIVAGTPSATPSNIQESVSSAYAAATDSAASLYSSAPPLSSVGSDTYSSVESLASVVSKSGESLLADATAAVPIYASDVSASAESLAYAASTALQAAASSLSSALLPSNVQKALDDAQSTLAHAYSEASHTLLLAAGIQPSPTDLSQSANSVYSQATAYLADYQASASSLLASYASEASKTAYSLAGQPTATGYQASAESAYALASASAASYADSLASEVSSAAANAQLLAQKVAGDAYALLPTLPATADLPAVSDVTSTLSSQIRQATRDALKAVGVSVTPESLQEHAESLYSQAAAAAGTAGSAGQGVLSDLSSSVHSATRVAASAAGYTPSPESPAEFAASVYDRASSAAAYIGADAQALAEDASSSVRSRARSVAKAAGYTPSPESPAEYAESIYAAAQDVAVSLASSVSQAVPTVPSGSDISSGASSLYSEASATASSAIDAASSAAHSATRSVASALGAEVTPEGASQYVASVASSVSSVANKASQAVRDRVEL